jgi:hypothetical protein
MGADSAGACREARIFVLSDFGLTHSLRVTALLGISGISRTLLVARNLVELRRFIAVRHQAGCQVQKTGDLADAFSVFGSHGERRRTARDFHLRGPP